ncbi:MAG: hypothetical protein PSX81_03740 [bacterium]|nr:hypothetical protein [bacterium]
MSIDLLTFRKDLEEANFQIGIDKGMWNVADENLQCSTWPKVIIWIKAASKNDGPERYYFNFDLTGYPNTAPTCCPWSSVKDERLPDELWPKGIKVVSSVFNPGWNKTALYAPCDRVAMIGHENWKSEFPHLWWNPSFTIEKYLNFLYRILNSSDYANS